MSSFVLMPVDGGLRARLASSAATPGRMHGFAAPVAARFTTALLRTAHGRAHVRHVALVNADGEVCASALLHSRTARFEGRPIEACVIEDIVEHAAAPCDAVLPTLLDRVAADVATRTPGAALVMATVPAGAVPRGFIPLPSDVLTVVVAESSRRGAPMVPIRSGHPDDYGIIATYPRLGSDGQRLCFEGSPALIEYAVTRQRLLAGLAPAGARELWFLVVEEGMRAAAHLLISVTPGHWSIEACGDRDPTGARVGAMLQMLIAREPAERRPVISARFPSGFLPPQLTVTGSTPASTSLCARALGIDLPLAALAAADLGL